MAALALLHPGAMGSRVGGELVALGHEVRWLPDGRRKQTAARAAAEGLTPARDVAALVSGVGLVLSVVPPQFALDVAQLARVTLTPVYVFPVLDADYNLVRTERRTYDARVTLIMDANGQVLRERTSS